MMTMKHLVCGAAVVLLLAAVMVAAQGEHDAPTPVTNSNSNSTHPLTGIPVHMGWKAWYVLFAIIGMLIVLIAGVADCMSVIIAISTSCYILGIISLKELFTGMANEGVLSIVMLFVIVHPIAELPLIKHAVRFCLRSVKPGGSMRWALFNVCLSSMLLSSFLENIPQVAMFTGLIRDICQDLSVYPSQLLLPMDYSVLIGNYAIIGSSNNLVISGLMVKFGMAEMSFFELAKVNGPMSVVALLYLVFAPRFLLPREKGGLLKMHKVEKAVHNISVKVLEDSTLIGMHAKDVGKAFPGDHGQLSCSFVSIMRPDGPADPEKSVLVAGDLLTVYGGAEVVLGSLDILGLSCIDCAKVPCDFNGTRSELDGDPLSDTQRGSDKNALLGSSKPSVDNASEMETIVEKEKAVKTDDGADRKEDGCQHSAPVAHSNAAENGNPAEGGSPTSTKALVEGDQFPQTSIPVTDGSSLSPATASPTRRSRGAMNVEASEKSAASSFIDLGAMRCSGRRGPIPDRVLFEVILGADSPLCGFSPMEADPLRRYTASIVGVKVQGKALDRPALEHHTLAAGNSILLFAPSYFNDEWGHEFVLITKLADLRRKVLEANYFRLPKQSPIGRFVRVDSEHKYVRVPIWWPYLSLVAFFGIILGTLLGVPLAGCCVVAVCFLVACGVTSPKDALHHIDWHVFVLVAFSFGIGISVDRSGLAQVVGHLALEANVTGFPLLLLISYLTTILANAVSNKTAAQVMFPIVFAIYQAEGLDPLPGIMVLASTSCLALSTPYGYACNLMVMEPGGYTAADYVRFGVPLNLIIGFLIPLTAWLVY